MENITLSASLKRPASVVACVGPQCALGMEVAGWASSDLCRTQPMISGSEHIVSVQHRFHFSCTPAFLGFGNLVIPHLNLFHPPPCLFYVIIRDVENDLIPKTTQTVSSVLVNYRSVLLHSVSKLTVNL